MWIDYVTYWRSTELSIKRCTRVNNRCIRSKISGYPLYPLDVVEFGADAHGKQVYVKKLYSQVPQTASVSWCQLDGVQVAVRGSENQLQTEGLGAQDPG